MDDHDKIATIEVAGEVLGVYRSVYRTNKRLGIMLFDEVGMPYASVSVNLTDQPMGEDEFAVHHDINGVVRDDLLRSGLFEDTGRKVSYGGVQDQPVWRLKEVM